MVSYAQNGEDVVLRRALAGVSQGRYIEVGANHPTNMSVTRSFYDAGWNGITVEPVAEYARLHRAERPRDTFVEAAISSTATEVVLHEFPSTGLSTLVDEVSERHAGAGFERTDHTVPARRLDDLLDEAGWVGIDIHFMVVDVEGAEADVLQSIDLTVWRPWIIVIESTAPLTTTTTHDVWEPGVLAAGYEFCLFDGISRFYVATERAAAIGAALTYPACALDDYAPALEVSITAERDEALRDLVRWRTAALGEWSKEAARVSGPERAELVALRTEVTAMRRTVSWRLTRPLRGVRKILPR